jgi:hypothetical protein
MGTVFEMALILNLQPELESDDIETLIYMTRSQDYNFQSSLNDSFFTECPEGFDQEWRIIIANNHPRTGEAGFSQIHRSVFCNNQLCFRILIDDDTYYNTWWAFSDWLFLISSNEGLVGYLRDVTCIEMEVELISFEKDKVTLQYAENQKIPDSLVHPINELLGGTGCVISG